MSSDEQETRSNDLLIYLLLFGAAFVATAMAFMSRYHVFGMDLSESLYWKVVIGAIISVIALIGKVISDLITPES